MTDAREAEQQDQPKPTLILERQQFGSGQTLPERGNCDRTNQQTQQNQDVAHDVFELPAFRKDFNPVSAG
tara:strand:- start:332 stop:541 length:210 start_codon:yes stop_codon:yes gene_type:complete